MTSFIYKGGELFRVPLPGRAFLQPNPLKCPPQGYIIPSGLIFLFEVDMFRFLLIGLLTLSSTCFAESYNSWYRYTAEDAQRIIKEGFDVNSTDDKGKPAILYATLNENNPGVLTALLQAKADPNATDKEGAFPLFLAAGQNKKTTNIIALLRAGADVNKTKEGVTPLMIAANQNTNPRILATLIQGRANVNAKDDIGNTALVHALVKKAPLSVINVLIRGKADVNVKCLGDATPLMIALHFHGNPEVIDALLKAGADVKAKTKDGKTVLDYAQRNPAIVNSPIFAKLQAAAK